MASSELLEISNHLIKKYIFINIIKSNAKIYKYERKCIAWRENIKFIFPIYIKY